MAEVLARPGALTGTDGTEATVTVDHAVLVDARALELLERIANTLEQLLFLARLRSD